MWVALFAAVAALAQGQPYSHKVTTLPQYNDPTPINFDQYAGHLVLPSNGQRMFYWLVESEANPAIDPLVLWLNGGPGCSSLGGFFTELGPFVIESDLSVKRNPYAWNRRANMLFLESPAGVGFSQPILDAANYNDDFTTDRIYEFLTVFYDHFPTYRSRPFYVTGESYAGMYIPFLAHKLVTEPLPFVNFTGIAIGNAYTDVVVHGDAYMDYLYNHALISIESYDAVVSNCPPSMLWQCVDSKGPDSGPNCTDPCLAAFVAAQASANLDALDPYNIYGDVCRLQNGQAQKLPFHAIRANTHRGEITPCADTFAQAYLRLPAVQDAIHVGEGHVNWTDCTAIPYTSSDSSLPKYPAILQAGLQVLIYSGDADTVVNFVGTQRWIHGLDLAVQTPWQAWFGPDKQLAGYTETYTNLTFATIKGAGHMAPATRPLHALYLFECFVHGPAACASFSYHKDSLEYLSGADLTAPAAAVVVVGNDAGMKNGKSHHSKFWWAAAGVVVLVAGLAIFDWRSYHYARI
ncbi:Aste57867_2304 [Aphanomyces stellatus]|uniref:Carboxypeptidase n=1 Tax=Aphanomyces stellatus TaxID=120398 RepID=A0A485KCX9_9STRA|nr:hypothetical protein As57867_002299 [Aphanomyces stellatus]VFT79507.1 Aste57867_2304 [Aphanomyces stellatus]